MYENIKESRKVLSRRIKQETIERERDRERTG